MRRVTYVVTLFSWLFPRLFSLFPNFFVPLTSPTSLEQRPRERERRHYESWEQYGAWGAFSSLAVRTSFVRVKAKSRRQIMCSFAAAREGAK